MQPLSQAALAAQQGEGEGEGGGGNEGQAASSGSGAAAGSGGLSPSGQSPGNGQTSSWRTFWIWVTTGQDVHPDERTLYESVADAWVNFTPIGQIYSTAADFSNLARGEPTKLELLAQHGQDIREGLDGYSAFGATNVIIWSVVADAVGVSQWLAVREGHTQDGAQLTPAAGE